MSDKVNIDRAERIAKLMREKGITSNQISTRTGLAYSTVQHIVAGKPTTRLHEVARVLDTTAAQLNGE